MKLFVYILAIIAGSVLSFESAIYGKLGENIGQLETSFYNFLMGTLILGVLVLFFGKGKLSYVSEAPKWSLLG